MNGLDSTLYYTFSTVAQTLAGGLGLLAAFMVIRLGTVNQQLHAYGRQLYETAGADDAIRGHWIAGNKAALFGAYRTTYEAVKAKGGTGNPPRMFLNSHHEAVLTAAEALLGAKGRLMKQLKSALSASALVIVACFVLLTLVHVLTFLPLVAYGALGVVVLGAAYCIVSYLRLLRTALRDG